MDIIPGAAALKKLSGVARVTSFAGNIGKLGKTTAQSSIRKVNDLSIAAGKEASIRLENVGAVMKERAREVPSKLAEGAIGAGRVADETFENMRNLFGFKKPSSEFAFAGDVVEQTGTDPHFFEDSMKGMLSNIKGLNIEGKGVVKGAGEGVEHVGRLKGKEVILKDILEKEVTYTKRDREEFKQLRNKFNNSVRKNFLQDLASDEKKFKQLFDTGLTEIDVKNFESGLVPDGYQVHHKLPLDDGGTNDFKNLILIKNDPYHKVLTNSQKNLTKGMEVGDSINIKWPIPEGFIYPTTK